MPPIASRRIVNISLSLLALLYAALPALLYGTRAYFHAAQFGGFWSPDEGVRFGMIRNWMDHGSLIHLHYNYSKIDPTGDIHPTTYFIFHRQHDFVVMYQGLFPLLSGVMYRILGFPALTLIPSICGLICVATTCALARRLGLRFAAWLPLVLGLATPLLLYSVVFWDHTAMMMIVSIASLWLLNSIEDGTVRSAVIAGAVAGSGMWIHEQSLAFAAACWLAALPLYRSHGNVLKGLPIGFGIAGALWCLSNLWIYGSLGGAHLGANVFQNNADHEFSLSKVLDIRDFGDRALDQLVGTYISPGQPELSPYYTALTCALIAFTYWSWEGGGKFRNAICLCLLATASVMALWLVYSVRNLEAPNGLFEATPVAILALAVPWYARKPGASGPERSIAFISRACGLFVIFLLINPMLPGVDWGSRYLLSALPLLALLGMWAGERFFDGAAGNRKSMIAAGMGLTLCASLACQAFSLYWVHRCLAYEEDMNDRLKAVTSPVIVTDSDFNARLTSEPKDQARFCVRSDDDGLLLLSYLRQREIHEIAFVGTSWGAENLSRALRENDCIATKVEERPFNPLDPARKIGDAFLIQKFILSGQARAQDGDTKTSRFQ